MQMDQVRSRVRHHLWETVAMRQVVENHRGWSRWYWLLLVPCSAVLGPPLFNAAWSSLAGMPFFYWYQLLWVLLGAGLTAMVYIAARQ